MDATPLTERAKVAVTSAAISIDGRSVTTSVLAACNWGVGFRVVSLGIGVCDVSDGALPTDIDVESGPSQSRS